MKRIALVIALALPMIACTTPIFPGVRATVEFNRAERSLDVGFKLSICGLLQASQSITFVGRVTGYLVGSICEVETEV